MALLWTRAQPAIRGFIAMTIRDRHAVEDVTQEVAVAIAKDFAAYDSSRSFKSWALGIARFRVLQYLDKTRRDRLIFSDDILSRLAEQSENLSTHQVDYETALEYCLAKLPEKTRRVVVMKYQRDLLVREIAEQSDTTPGVVTGLLRRARVMLAVCVRQRLSIAEGRGS